MVAEHYPWPAVDGIRQRLDHVISGLATAGQVEVIAMDRRTPEERASSVQPQFPGLVDVSAIPVRPDVALRDWLPGWIRGGPPRRLLHADWSAMSEAFAARFAPADDGSPARPVDLIWYSHVDSWWPLHAAAPAGVSSIVDFYDLVNLALHLRRATPPRFVPGAGVADRARTAGRWALSRGFDLVDERRWDRYQQICAATVDRVVVCSELDRTRSGLDHVSVIGNGSSAPEVIESDRRELRGAVPTFLFVGALDYEPNSEAVEWFVRDVFPAVRAQVPSARVRIVGRGVERVAWVASQPGVDLIGPVPEMRDELDRADASVVPIRVGAGTRLKVVEALANHLPLVTTSVGCEGISVTHGVDALIADDAASFAAACVAVATDATLRQRLADTGSELFAARYDWTIIEAQLAKLAIAVIADEKT